MKCTFQTRAVFLGMLLWLAVPSFGQWELVWQDEFDGNSLNLSKWTAVSNCGDKRNNEQQCYMASAVKVDSGVLTITGTNQPQGSFAYTSGAVKTGTKFSQAFGRFEFYVKLPVGGKGVWPALWLYPPNQWPPEIDVLEAVNDMSKIYMTYHWGTSSTHQLSMRNTTINNPNDWHQYAMEWDSDSIKWYIDGVLKRAYSDTTITNIPMQLYINLALGGEWPGSVDSLTVFPQIMLVDYVRVYRKIPSVHSLVRQPKPVGIMGPRSTYDLRGCRITPRQGQRATRVGVIIESADSNGLGCRKLIVRPQ